MNKLKQENNYFKHHLKQHLKHC